MEETPKQIETTEEISHNPLLDAIVKACMDHGRNENGLMDYPAIGAAMINVLADMIAPQSPVVQKHMVKDLRASLEGAVMARSVRRAAEIILRAN